jgi:hypothetical protein
VLVGTLRPNEAQPGRNITYDAGTFTFEGGDPIALDELVEHDREGQLEWADPGTRAWVLSRGRRGSGPAPTSAPPAGSGSRAGAPAIRWALVAPVIVVAVAVAVLSVALSRHISQSHPEPWPGVFEGTWRFERAAEGFPLVEGSEVIFGRSAEEGTIRELSGFSQDYWSEFAFHPDTMTVTVGGDPVQRTYRRTTDGGGNYLGRYESTRDPAMADDDNSYLLEFDGKVLKLTIFPRSTEADWTTYKLSKDRKLMVMESGGSGIPGVFIFKKVDAGA